MESQRILKPVHRLAADHPDRTAIKDVNGTHSYRDVLTKAVMLSKKIRESIGQSNQQERICFLCPNDITYVVTQWACWAAGCIGKVLF